MELDFEHHRYEEAFEGLLRERRGEWVLIIGEDEFQFFQTWKQARAAGLERRGNVPMLIKCIEPERPESIPFVTNTASGASSR